MTERPAWQLEQRCVEPGHWIIEGRDVRAVYQGRGRTIIWWNVTGLKNEDVPNPFLYLGDARAWIQDRVNKLNGRVPR